jgi:hypothetical protein
MIRILLGLLIAAHGLLHLVGTAYGFRLQYTSPYTGHTTIPLPLTALRLVNLLWLAACVLLIAAALLYVFKKEGWWMLGITAVALSQTLIIRYWSEARWGTVANVLILVVLVAGYGQWRFNRVVQQEVQALLSAAPASTGIVSEEQVRPLPPVVQQWLRRSGVVGKPQTHTAHLQQKVQLRTQPGGKWMPVKAEQYISTGPPGFVWVADVKAAPGVHLAGRDRYHNGKGHMLIKLLWLYPIANNKGSQIDQGSLLRYLAEIVWVPSAALRPYIHWEGIDNHHARATMSYGGITASGTFGFSAEGDVESFEALRYYDRKEGATLEPWQIQIEPGAYREFEGVRIPVRTTVTWQLKDGPFTWFRLEILEANYE